MPYEEFVAYERAAVSEKINRDGEKAHVKRGDDETETQKLFRNIIAGTEEVVVVFDNNTKELLYANRAAEQYYGKQFDPINPTTCMEYCNHFERCKSCPAIGMKPNERREFSTTEKGRCLKTMYAQMKWNGHDAVGYYQMDVTEQMKELAFSDDLIHNMLGATFTFELGKDGTPKLCYVSDNAAKIFRVAGIKDENPSFEELFNIVHISDREQVQNALAVLFSEKTSMRVIFRFVLANGGIMWVEALVNPVLDRDDSYLFYSIYTDITEQKRIEEDAEL